MPKFKYAAMDSRGVESEGIVEAETQTEALAAIRSKGVFPTKIFPISDGGQKKSARVSAQVGDGSGKRKFSLPHIFGARVRNKHLMVFTRQLATLIDAGLPLLRALRILLRQEKNPALRQALNGMGEAVEGGSTFSEACAQFPRVFDKLFVNMIKAGEAGGVLEVVLNRLAEFMEKAERIKNKVISVMIYPIVVLIAAMAILTFMMVKIIPKFKEVFEGLMEGKALPKLTQFVMGTSSFVAHHGIWILVFMAVVVIVLKALGKTKKGGFVLDKIKLKVPMFGSLLTKTAVARWARTLGTLMTSGVPVLQALNIVRETAGNEVIAGAIQEVHDSVKEGDTMAMPLEAAGVFPDMVISMVDVGEETGALPEMLIKVADTYETEVDTAVEGLMSIIEPLLIIGLAVIIGTIVISMFVPLISIMTTLGSQ